MAKHAAFDAELERYIKMIALCAPVALADTMHSAWCHFIKSGVPASDATDEWPGYDLSRRATMMFDKTSKLADDRTPHGGFIGKIEKWEVSYG